MRPATRFVTNTVAASAGEPHRVARALLLTGVCTESPVHEHVVTEKRRHGPQTSSRSTFSASPVEPARARAPGRVRILPKRLLCTTPNVVTCVMPMTPPCTRNVTTLASYLSAGDGHRPVLSHRRPPVARRTVSDAAFEANRRILDPLVAFIERRGRTPEPGSWSRRRKRLRSVSVAFEPHSCWTGASLGARRAEPRKRPQRTICCCTWRFRPSGDAPSSLSCRRMSN